MSDNRWFLERRLSWIVENVRIFGQLNRENIVKKFDVSVAQASVDIRMIMSRYPGFMKYNATKKRYELVDSTKADIKDKQVSSEIFALQDALSQVLLYIPDANNAQSPHIISWHKKHRDVIEKAAEVCGRSHLISY